MIMTGKIAASQNGFQNYHRMAGEERQMMEACHLHAGTDSTSLLNNNDVLMIIMFIVE